MITIQNLDFGYGKKKHLFNNLGLSLTQGHIYGLLGKNGAGKSTLIKIIAGSLLAKNGEVCVMGYNPADRKPNFLNQLSFIPEDVYSSDLKIRTFVKVMSPFYPNFSNADFERFAAEFEVDLNVKLSELSFGQKKKTIIAFGLATNSPLLIMDEPTNGLDIPSKRQFRRIVASIATESRCIIISTHQVRDLDNLIDSIIVLDDGEITLNRSVDEITNKLSFKTVDNELASTAIYGETSLRGTTGVFANPNHDDSKLDMELLFNAMLVEKDKMLTVLNSK